MLRRPGLIFKCTTWTIGVYLRYGLTGRTRQTALKALRCATPKDPHSLRFQELNLRCELDFYPPYGRRPFCGWSPLPTAAASLWVTSKPSFVTTKVGGAYFFSFTAALLVTISSSLIRWHVKVKTGLCLFSSPDTSNILLKGATKSHPNSLFQHLLPKLER